ncbi:restriction endonuclease subunit S [Flavobacterium sp. NG2]|uniref:restriction endonuclease subunit S n=1 Tax=Flavobacterium sp. NG2 TaxID=3097547 RepID=UPI002A7EE52A|nr:restriction endonuclease subunit S [Flavobacterium sp. NG2]WPR70663.1 restriction endonuclease subunit S [Flavobacterium sp. NG2]
MGKELPKNWVNVSLQDVTKNVKGKKPKIQSEIEFEGSIPYMDIKALEYSVIRQFADIESSKLFEEGDVAMVWDGARSGWVSKTNFGAIGSTLVAFKPIKINSNYLFYYLLDKYPFINSNARGVGIPHVDPTVLWDLKFPLPPLAEQNRIVDKLDRLFAQLETIKTSMEKVPLLLKDFRQQVLTQAVTGKLTEEWRKGKELEAWKNILLNDICNSITDGDHQAPPQVNEGVPFLVISNVSKGYFEFEKVSRFVPQEYYNSLKETRKPQKGDLLYTVTGSYGIPLLVDFDKEFCFQRHIAILRPDNNKIYSNFLKILLKSDLIYTQARNVATGTAQLTVPLGGIKKFEIKLPTLNEQQEIVNRVESLFGKADTIEEQYKSLKNKIDTLPQAILHKAFKGELSEQLDSDDDARELLQSIQSLRAERGTRAKRIEPLANPTKKGRKQESNNKKLDKKSTTKEHEDMIASSLAMTAKNYPEGDGVLGMVAEEKIEYKS